MQSMKAYCFNAIEPYVHFGPQPGRLPLRRSLGLPDVPASASVYRMCREALEVILPSWGKHDPDFYLYTRKLGQDVDRVIVRLAGQVDQAIATFAGAEKIAGPQRELIVLDSILAERGDVLNSDVPAHWYYAARAFHWLDRASTALWAGQTDTALTHIGLAGALIARGKVSAADAPIHGVTEADLKRIEESGAKERRKRVAQGGGEARGARYEELAPIILDVYANHRSAHDHTLSRAVDLIIETVRSKCRPIVKEQWRWRSAERVPGKSIVRRVISEQRKAEGKAKKT